MKREILKKDIEILNLDFQIQLKLRNNSINIIEKLWNLSRHDLKNFGFRDSEINKMIIKLQLLGLDLNHKKY